MSGAVRQASLLGEAVEELREAALCRAPDVRPALPFPPSVNRCRRHVFSGGCARVLPSREGRRDIDNRGGKALLDALTEAGARRDDSRLDELRIRRCGVAPGGRCVVDIRRLDGAGHEGDA